MWSEITPSFEKQVHNALKGQQQPAQGSAFGGRNGSKLTPYRGKSITTRVCCCFNAKLLHLQRVLLTRHATQGAALGYERVGLAGRFLNKRVYLYISSKIEEFKNLRI